jgi:F-type H+-transporting ATPase subunit epsilon
MDKTRLIHVKIVSPERVVYDGQVESVVLPGESGVFEVQPYHKRLLSRLLGGRIIAGKESFYIRRGVAQIGVNKVTIIAEEAPEDSVK